MASRLQAFLEAMSGSGSGSGSATIEADEGTGGDGGAGSSGGGRGRGEEEPQLTELVFTFDTTGSMYESLVAVKAELRKAVAKMIAELPHLRIGVVAHGDYCDGRATYVTKICPFTSDVGVLETFIGGVARTGGGDPPECYEYALQLARTAFQWTPGSSRAVVVIGDHVPHPPSYTNLGICWRSEMAALQDHGVTLYATAPFYETLAEATGGFLLHVDEMAWMPLMFVGLCYRQTSLEAFEDYRMQLIWNKVMDHNTPLNTLFMEMATPTVIKAHPEYNGHLREPWWDAAYDLASSPAYIYDDETESWNPAPGSADDLFAPVRPRPRRRRRRNADSSDPEPESSNSATGPSPPKRQKRNSSCR
ncbi:uncharacterized protein AMSG_07624, partial [Thecamonas trahens ATCC 50062]